MACAWCCLGDVRSATVPWRGTEGGEDDGGDGDDSTPPGRCKAFFRRGKARCELRDFGGARADLERARELAPEDPAIPAELRRVRAAFEHGDAAERRQCAKMFPEAAAAAPADAAPADADAAADAAAPASTDASVEVAAPSRDEAAEVGGAS